MLEVFKMAQSYPINIVGLALLLVLSGCIYWDDSPEPSFEGGEDTLSEEISDNHSFQFWNIYPMSVGNTSMITFNNSGDLFVTLELVAFFHEPIVGDQGWINYSLIYDNETVWFVETDNNTKDYTFNLTNFTGNITVKVESNGSDNQNDNKPGDLFIAKANFELVY
jgi:hypothetical protein